MKKKAQIEPNVNLGSLTWVVMGGIDRLFGNAGTDLAFKDNSDTRDGIETLG